MIIPGTIAFTSWAIFLTVDSKWCLTIQHKPIGDYPSILIELCKGSYVHRIMSYVNKYEANRNVIRYLK